MSFNFNKGEFVCVVGEIGSGKSTLINSVLGELIHVSPETLLSLGEKKSEMEEVAEMLRIGSTAKGVIQRHGSVALVEQQPWIQNKTI